MNHKLRLTALALLCTTICAPALAAEPTLPAWDQLSAETRETLIAPARDRWNNEPAERERMLERAQRWSALTPEQRDHARHGMERWQQMSPAQRVEAQALYAKMRGMDLDARKALRTKWRAMTPQQRKEWVDANPAPEQPDRPR